jgi:hypothetical protein
MQRNGRMDAGAMIKSHDFFDMKKLMSGAMG